MPMKNSSRRAAAATRKGAFTLVELLLAMAILVVIVMLVSQIFNQAMVTWDSGSRKADVNVVGRTLADFMAQELSKAVFDGVIFNEFSIPPPGGATARFITMDKPPNASNRTVRLVEYQFVPSLGLGNINRTTYKWDNGIGSGVVYTGISWVAVGAGAILETSAPLCPPPAAGRNVAYVKSVNYFRSDAGKPPAYVDVAIEVVRMEDFMRAIPGTVMLFTSRAWMANRQRCCND